MNAGRARGSQDVEVIIPYYRDQEMLDRILSALHGQTGLDRVGLELIVFLDVDCMPGPELGC